MNEQILLMLDEIIGGVFLMSEEKAEIVLSFLNDLVSNG